MALHSLAIYSSAWSSVNRWIYIDEPSCISWCQDFRELNVPYASYRTNLNIYENCCAVTKWNKIQPQGYVDMLLSKQKACLNSISNQITWFSTNVWAWSILFCMIFNFTFEYSVLFSTNVVAWSILQMEQILMCSSEQINNFTWIVIFTQSNEQEGPWE
jgi:hypothetical protein